jgi:hypothetical protein
MTELMEAHKQLSEELETILDAIINPEYGDLPEYLRDAIMKDRNRLEMLLEVLEEDPLYEIPLI